MTHTTAVHPGLVLQDELEERDIAPAELAVHLHLKPRLIKELCAGKRSLSDELAVQLSRALGASPTFWLNLQKNWELSQVDEKRFSRIDRIAA